MEILIDGYNLMWTMENLNSIGHFDFNRAKDLLVEIIRRYGEFCGGGIVLILDGYKGNFPYTVVKEEEGGLTLVYTAKNMTADRWIIERCGRKNFTGSVVTSDLEIIRFAESLEIPVVRSKKFAERLMEYLMVDEDLNREIKESQKRKKGFRK